MMILTTFRLCALGALLAGTAVPSLAEGPGAAVAAPMVQNTQRADTQRADSGRSRRVELPFPLDTRVPDRAPQPPVWQEDAGPHPFRETHFKRASLAEQPATRRRLSRQPVFG